MLYLSIALGLSTVVLAYLLYQRGKEIATLEYTIRGKDKEINILEAQNETLAKAVKSNNPDYDIDKLFNGGF
jgi:cell division protein FtsL